MIDDDVELNALLTEYFARFGFRLSTVTTAAEGRRAIRTEDVDLIILDIMLPDDDGLSLCKEIRSEFSIPIVMLTARGEVADRVVGLELGADDYVPKPFEPRELVARIESVLRRSAGGDPDAILNCDGLRLEVGARRVTHEGTILDLTTMEFELLRLLMESHGRVLTRDMLIDKLRGIDAEAYDRSVDMLISRLRSKLSDDSRSPRYIKTIWRIGYQFVGADN